MIFLYNILEKSDERKVFIMKEIFKNSNATANHRLLALTAASCMLSLALTGCFGGDKVSETLPETEPPILLETEAAETEAVTEAPTEAATEPAPNVIVDGKTVTITGAPVEVRSAVGPDGLVMGKLEVGSQSEILRQVELDGINWALVREGWICLDNIDLDSLVTEDDDDRESITVVPDEEKDDKPEKPHRPSMDGVADGSNQTAQTVNKKGYITAGSLNVRSEPNTTSSVVDTLNRGEWVNVIEKKGDWGHIQSGWISLKYVSFSGNSSQNNDTAPSNPADVIARGVVTTDGLNIRSGAGTDNSAVGSYNYGERVEFVDKTTVGDTTWGKTNKGWISLSYVYMDGTRTNDAATGTVTGDLVNVRRGPGTGNPVVATVSSGDSVEVLAQFKFGGTTWGCLSNGWISMDFVKMGN